MGEFHLLGGSSPIAQLLAKKLKQTNHVTLYSSRGNGQSLECFLSKNLSNSMVIYFCNIQDNLNANINLLEKITHYCNKFNCKFIFISSINAENPSASLYSTIKHECEKIVTKNQYIFIRLAIVISDPPFSSYKALKKLDKIPVKFIFGQEQYIHFTQIECFLNLDFNEIQNNMNLYNSSMKLNNFFSDKKINIFKINMWRYISILKKINATYPLKSIFGRLLTLTAFNRDFLK
jgi:hypothetical protein